LLNKKIGRDNKAKKICDEPGEKCWFLKEMK
jgi:hypothetical protein